MKKIVRDILKEKDDYKQKKLIANFLLKSSEYYQDFLLRIPQEHLNKKGTVQDYFDCNKEELIKLTELRTETEKLSDYFTKIRSFLDLVYKQTNIAKDARYWFILHLICPTEVKDLDKINDE